MLPLTCLCHSSEMSNVSTPKSMLRRFKCKHWASQANKILIAFMFPPLWRCLYATSTQTVSFAYNFTHASSKFKPFITDFSQPASTSLIVFIYFNVIVVVFCYFIATVVALIVLTSVLCRGYFVHLWP